MWLRGLQLSQVSFQLHHPRLVTRHWEAFQKGEQQGDTEGIGWTKLSPILLNYYSNKQ